MGAIKMIKIKRIKNSAQNIWTKIETNATHQEFIFVFKRRQKAIN